MTKAALKVDYLAVKLDVWKVVLRVERKAGLKADRMVAHLVAAMVDMMVVGMVAVRAAT